MPVVGPEVTSTPTPTQRAATPHPPPSSAAAFVSTTSGASPPRAHAATPRHATPTAQARRRRQHRRTGLLSRSTVFSPSRRRKAPPPSRRQHPRLTLTARHSRARTHVLHPLPCRHAPLSTPWQGPRAQPSLPVSGGCVGRAFSWMHMLTRRLGASYSNCGYADPILAADAQGTHPVQRCDCRQADGCNGADGESRVPADAVLECKACIECRVECDACARV